MRRKSVISSGSQRAACGAVLIVFASDGAQTSRMQSASTAHTGPPVGEILFQRTVSPGNQEIFVVKTDGTGLRRLTTSDGFDGAARWSPDGNRIVFVSQRDAAASGGPRRIGLYIMNSDGSNVQRLMTDDNACSSPSWSHDGRKVVFVASPSLRTESTADAASAQRHLFAIEVATRELKQLSFEGDDNFPAWSPNGKSIAFASVRVKGEDWSEIYVMNADGTHVRRLTFNVRRPDCCQDTFPRWSPNGR